MKYHLLTRHAESVNQLNRLHIMLENIGTPREVEGAFASLLSSTDDVIALDDHSSDDATGVTKAELREYSLQWIKSLKVTSALFGEDGAAFRRRKLARQLYLYLGPRPAKKLIIGFTGNMQRLMMPACFVLNKLDPSESALALLRTERDQGYRTGIIGLSNNLLESIDRLPEVLSFGQYSEVNIIGTSGGALPAILAGLRLQCRNIVAVGPNAPSDDRWRTYFEDGEGRECLKLLGTEPPHESNLFLVFGAKASRDEKAVAEIMNIQKAATALRVSDAHHNCLIPLYRGGTFRSFLEKTVLAPSS